MGAISNHYGDVQNWVEKVIDSCETQDQTDSARKLVWNFENQMRNNKVDISIRHSIGHHLTCLVHDKMDELLIKKLS
jgi:2,3-bisphosphoglycerate-independent phosphoglycerate mutase